MSKEKLRKRMYDRMPAEASEYQPLPFVGAYASAISQYLFNSSNSVEKRIAELKEQAAITANRIKDTHPLITKHGMTKEQAAEHLRNYAKHLLALEDAKDIYLRMPQRTGTMLPAKYTPSINNDKTKPLPTYRSTYLSDPFVVEEFILPAVSNLKRSNVKSKDAKDFAAGDIYSIGRSGKNANTLLPLAGHATVGYNISPKKGEYVSYFDQWDINMHGKAGGKDHIAKVIDAQPFNLYDRIYLDDYYGVDTSEGFKQEKKKNSNTYYGGWLPEIKVNSNDEIN